MINFLYFCAGAGFGAFISIMVLIWAVGRVNKKSADRAEKYNKETVELMRERNRIGEKTRDTLSLIASNLLERKL